MSKIAIGEAAKIIEVSKRTLMRWEKSGVLPAKREEVSNIRVYESEVIIKISKWRNLKRIEKEHLSKLRQIQDKIDLLVAIKPLDDISIPKGHELKELKEVYDARREWKKKLNKIHREQEHFTEDYFKKIPDE